MSQVLMETNSSNAVQNYYVYGPTGLLYRVKADNTTYHYYHYDYRGSTTAITNEAQNVTHSYSYDPFGKVLAKTEADDNPFQYVGKYGVQYESPTLTFMRARYYDPTTGRFVSEDPIWALNLYPYADNNPINIIDFDGNKGLNLMDYYRAAYDIVKEKAENLVDKALNYAINKHNSSVIKFTSKAIDISQAVKESIETALGIELTSQSNQWYLDKYNESVKNKKENNWYLAGYALTSLWSSLDNAKTTLDAFNVGMTTKEVIANYQKLTGSIYAMQKNAVTIRRIMNTYDSAETLSGFVTDIYNGGLGLGSIINSFLNPKK
jgi:RHS repeat-associated protein